MEDDLTLAFTNPSTKKSAWSLVLASQDQLDSLAEQMPLPVLIKLALRELGNEALEPFILPFLISASGRLDLSEEMNRQGAVSILFDHMDTHAGIKLSLLSNLSRNPMGLEKLLENGSVHVAKLVSWVPREHYELATQVLTNISTTDRGRSLLSENDGKYIQFLSLFLDLTGVRGIYSGKILLNLLQSGTDFSKETTTVLLKRITEVILTLYDPQAHSSLLTLEQILSDEFLIPESREEDEGLGQLIDILGSLCRDADSLELVQGLQTHLLGLFQALYLAGRAGCLRQLKTVLEIASSAIII